MVRLHGCGRRAALRKLKPQVQSTVDGFIGGPDGAMDAMVWD
jgi:hypothetical protein